VLVRPVDTAGRLAIVAGPLGAFEVVWKAVGKEAQRAVVKVLVHVEGEAKELEDMVVAVRMEE